MMPTKWSALRFGAKLGDGEPEVWAWRLWWSVWNARARVMATIRGRIQPVHQGRTPEETPALWHELGRLYASAGGSGHRATKLGLTVVCAVGALVLLSA